MATTTLPEIPRPSFPMLEVGLPPADTWPRTLFTPDVLRTLDTIGERIDHEILVPLFLAQGVEELTRTFQRVYPRFAGHYFAATTLMLDAIVRHVHPGELMHRSFDVISSTLQEQGPSRIGKEATLEALIGVHSMARVFAALARTLAAKGPMLPPSLGEALADRWAQVMMAYMLTLGGVYFAVRPTLRIEPPPFVENAQILAAWSRGYAVHSYHLAKEAGFLRQIERPEEVAREESTQEELDLADSGLGDYTAILKRENDVRPDTR